MRLSIAANTGQCPYCGYLNRPGFGAMRCGECRRRFTGDAMTDRIPGWARRMGFVAILAVLLSPVLILVAFTGLWY